MGLAAERGNPHVIQVLMQSVAVKKLMTGRVEVASRYASLAEIRHPDLGLAWLAPDGRIWAQDVLKNADGSIMKMANRSTLQKDGIILNSPATRACVAAGGRLPPAQDVLELMRQFGLNMEIPDFIFSDLTPEGTASLQNGHANAVSFYGSDGKIFSDSQYSPAGAAFPMAR